MNDLKWLYCVNEDDNAEFARHSSACDLRSYDISSAQNSAATESQDRIEKWRGKTVMVFTPHLDDDVFGCGGIIAMLARNGNKIMVVIRATEFNSQ